MVAECDVSRWKINLFLKRVDLKIISQSIRMKVFRPRDHDNSGEALLRLNVSLPKPDMTRPHDIILDIFDSRNSCMHDK